MIMDGSTWVAYKLFGVNRLSRSSPVAASSRPGTTVGGGPTLGSRLAASPSVRMMPAEEGRNAKPARSGVYP